MSYTTNSLLYEELKLINSAYFRSCIPFVYLNDEVKAVRTAGMLQLLAKKSNLQMSMTAPRSDHGAALQYMTRLSVTIRLLSHGCNGIMGNIYMDGKNWLTTGNLSMPNFMVLHSSSKEMQLCLVHFSCWPWLRVSYPTSWIKIYHMITDLQSSPKEMQTFKKFFWRRV